MYLDNGEKSLLDNIFRIINDKSEDTGIIFEIVNISNDSKIKKEIKKFIDELQSNIEKDMKNYAAFKSNVANDYVIERLNDIIK